MNWSEISVDILTILVVNGATGLLLYGGWRLALRLISRRMDIQVTYILLRLILLYFLFPVFGIWRFGRWLTNGYRGQLACLLGENLRLAAGVLMAIWLAGTLFLLGRYLFRQRRIVRLARLGSMPARIQWVQSAENVRGQLKLRRKIEVRERYGDRSVFVTGLQNPVIYLPEGIFTEDERLAILTHEMTHIQEGDLLWKAAAALVHCIYWPMNLPLILIHDVQDWSEFNCDYLSCSVLGSARDYFLLIERMISEEQRWYSSPWLTYMGQSRNELIRRMKAMINQQKLSPVRTRWILIVATGFLAAGSITVLAGIYSASMEYGESYWDNLNVIYEDADMALWEDRILPAGWEESEQTVILEPGDWKRVSSESFAQTDGVSTFFEWYLPGCTTFLSDPVTVQAGQEIALGCGPENSGDSVMIGMLYPDGVCHYSIIETDGLQIYSVEESGEYRLAAIHRSEGVLQVGGYFMIRD